MSIQVEIEQKLQQGIAVEYLVVENESHRHAGPAADSHFKLTVVSEDFVGKRPVARHQLIYKLLADELQGPVHALALHLYTGEEWRTRGEQAPDSAPCSGAR